MQEDFHYYATYCAAVLAGYSPKESKQICYSANFVDLCSVSYLARIRAPKEAATTQLTMEMADAQSDISSIQNITRIWSSFHFLPRDLNADVRRGSKLYKNKYRLICGPNGDLLVDTVKLAKGESLEAAGIAMHVLADTWAHMYFAGTPSQVINNTTNYFFEIMPEEEGGSQRTINFRHNPMKPDDLDAGLYTNSLHQTDEKAIMNLGHGRAGHLPDYSFMRYRYLPAWMDYEEVLKDNPSDYYRAFCQMIYALKYLRGEISEFEADRYDEEAAAPYKSEIREILCRRQLNACDDWKAFGEKISGESPVPFESGQFAEEYLNAGASEKDETVLGRFIAGALAQKSMVTNKIYRTGNRLAGISIEYKENSFSGIRAYHRLAEKWRKRHG